MKKQRKNKRKRPNDLSFELFYYQKSPNFCEKDPSVDFPGTAGRQCNKTSRGLDSCSSMCCGRGYNRIRERRTERQCVFKWCCEVICQNYTTEAWVTVCKWNLYDYSLRPPPFPASVSASLTQKPRDDLSRFPQSVVNFFRKKKFSPLNFASMRYWQIKNFINLMFF